MLELTRKNGAPSSSVLAHADRASTRCRKYALVPAGQACAGLLLRGPLVGATPKRLARRLERAVTAGE
jgi:hypothetical protein